MNYLKIKSLVILLSIFFLTISCNDDSEGTMLPMESKTYQLSEVGNSGVSGTAKFTDRSDGSVLVELMLMGTPQNGSHPSHIHFNTAAEGGGVAIGLNPVNGATGRSETIVNQLEDGTPISYTDLLNFDGYINIHLSANDLATVVAQGDIGQNELTGNSKSYDLGEKDVTGISGMVLFEERKNGEAQATIMLMGTPNDGMHPAHIHANSASEGGPILYTFGMVNGATGMIRTNISMLDDNTPFGYADILLVDAYINVHLSVNELATIVAQGDIGANAM
ncbi:MAG: hypothetical protein CMB99_09370 [Flavobacteriaceae bacterium]|nr:hypothetical protein [Flavobacteriaceae bacterium]|tara:strand:+ start:460894 stop:461727 length:834 start_codon:yes stop_codon:yes gene_type:complete